MFNKKGVFLFLGLTFGLTWLLDLAIYLRGGLASPGWVTALQLQMMLPAFSAILLGMFFLPDSPIYYKRDAGRGRWFYIYFLLYTMICALAVLFSWLNPAQGAISLMSSLLPQILGILGLVLLVVLRIATGRETMARVWLGWGNWRYYLLFGLAIVVFFILQAALNALFGLGSSDFDLIRGSLGLSPETFLIKNALQVLLAPVVGIVIGFGEEFGWRGFLQSELFKLGRMRGVLLLGLIWGVWHWPVILMGINYPDHPLLGLLLFVFFTTAASIVLGYAVLKSGSVLLAAYLHGLMNQVSQTLDGLGYAPYDSAFSFVTGIFGIAMMAIVALVILRDPIWRGRGGNMPLPTTRPVDMVLSINPEALEKNIRVS